ncbi:MAG: cation:proton antiporter, partial [Alphaproteobacteria bacterium]|nr:cation:proton antiporter [Alphaproteobacteria bacterium]
MTGTTDLLAFKDPLILLATAGIAVPLLHKLKINSIVSFLLLGAILGPTGLGSYVESFPYLGYVVIDHPEKLGLLGELGVVFLLFLIGIELSVTRLITMSRFVFGMGGVQLVLCASALAFLGTFVGLSQKAAVFIGIAFALSSTAIVIQYLARKKELKSLTGRVSFSILLFQDLAIIPVLFLFSVMNGGSQNPILYDVSMALGQAALVVMVIYVAGRHLLRPLFRLVASTESADLFVATTLLIIIGSAVAANAAGASLSLGAFISGLLISETQYSHAIRTVVEPFKGDR